MVKNISGGSRNDALPMYIHLKIPKCRETVPLSIVLRGSYTTVTREPSQWLTNLYDWLGGQPLGVHTACYSATSHADSVSAGSHGVHFTVSYSTYCSSRRSYGARARIFSPFMCMEKTCGLMKTCVSLWSPPASFTFPYVILPLCLSLLFISWDVLKILFCLHITLSSLVEKLRFLCD